MAPAPRGGKQPIAKVRAVEINLEGLEDDIIASKLHRAYVQDLPTSISYAFSAAAVEASTRFLQRDPPAAVLNAAEVLLKQGMLEHPQSMYLRLLVSRMGRSF